MQIEHEVLGLSYELPDFKQRDIEAFYAGLRELTGGVKLSNVEYNGNVVRTAAKLGWLEGLKEKGVDDMSPAAVNWLSSEISRAVAATFDIPGE